MRTIVFVRGLPILASAILLVACDPVQTPPPRDEPVTPAAETDVGELHNQGVRYVLEHTDYSVPEGEQLRMISPLILDWCRGEPWGPCEIPPAFPLEPVEWAVQVEQSEFSPAMKARLIRLETELSRAQTIAEFDAIAERSLAGDVEGLREGEQGVFEQVVSVARASARLWAPRDVGGQGGGDTALPDGGPRIDAIYWDAVWRADAMGCFVGAQSGHPLGCLAGAVVLSSAEIVRQSVE